jgi:hypothetical protein
VTGTKFNNDAVTNLMNFFKMNLFWAALLKKLQNGVAQKDQTMITLEEMYDIYTT